MGVAYWQDWVVSLSDFLVKKAKAQRKNWINILKEMNWKKVNQEDSSCEFLRETKKNLSWICVNNRAL